jgi:hypothetical protein
MRQIGLNELRLGDGAAIANKNWLADVGTLNLPGTRYNVSSSVMQFSNDGTNWNNMMGASTSLTVGSVLFAGSGGTITQDNTKLYWDNTLKMLGIGTNSPNAALHVVGNITAQKVSGLRNISINSGGLTQQDYVIGFNVPFGIADGYTNVFLANAISGGGHTGSNTIYINTTGVAQDKSINMMGTTNFGVPDQVVIGYGSASYNNSNPTNDPCTILGNYNTVSGNANSTGMGNIVFGFSNAVGSNRVASAGGNSAIVIGRSNTIRQNNLGHVAGFEKMVIGRGITDIQETVTRSSFGFGQNSYTSLYDNFAKNELFGGLLLTTSGYDLSSTNTKYHPRGVAPTSTPADSFALYGADIVAGNTAPHFRTEAGNIIKLYSETTAVGSAAFVGGSGAHLLENSTFDGYTVSQIVKALKNQGLLT